MCSPSHHCGMFMGCLCPMDLLLGLLSHSSLDLVCVLRPPMVCMQEAVGATGYRNAQGSLLLNVDVQVHMIASKWLACAHAMKRQPQKAFCLLCLLAVAQSCKTISWSTFPLGHGTKHVLRRTTSRKDPPIGTRPGFLLARKWECPAALQVHSQARSNDSGNICGISFARVYLVVLLLVGLGGGTGSASGAPFISTERWQYLSYNGLHTETQIEHFQSLGLAYAELGGWRTQPQVADPTIYHLTLGSSIIVCCKFTSQRLCTAMYKKLESCCACKQGFGPY